MYKRQVVVVVVVVVGVVVVVVVVVIIEVCVSSLPVFCTFIRSTYRTISIATGDKWRQLPSTSPRLDLEISAYLTRKLGQLYRGLVLSATMLVVLLAHRFWTTHTYSG